MPGPDRSGLRSHVDQVTGGALGKLSLTPLGPRGRPSAFGKNLSALVSGNDTEGLDKRMATLRWPQAPDMQARHLGVLSVSSGASDPAKLTP